MMTSDKSPLIDAKQMRIFAAIAEHRSLSSAATSLGMSQPYLSVFLNNLEKQIGSKLVVRRSRGIQLTEAGEMLNKRGRLILKDTVSLMNDIQSLNLKTSGLVSMGLPPSLSNILSVPLVETVHSENPGIRLQIAEVMSGHILEWIDSGQLDLGCVYQSPDKSLFHSEWLLTEELFLVTAPDNWPGPLQDGRAVDPIPASRLASFPLVMTRPAHSARNQIEKALHSAGIDLNVAMEIDSLPKMVEIVSRASAYSIMLHRAVASHVAAGELCIVPVEPKLYQKTYLVQKRDRQPKAAVKVVENTMMHIISEVFHRHQFCGIEYKFDHCENRV